MIKLYDSQALRETLGDLLAEADAICNMAKQEERELTTEENSRFDEILDQVGSNGDDGAEVTGIYASIAKAEKFEKMKAAAARPSTTGVATPQGSLDGGGQTQPAIPRARCRLKAFRSNEDAFRAGKWFKAQVTGDEDAKQWLRDYGNAEVNIQNVQTTKVDPDGGFITPDPMSSAILDAMDIFGAALVLARRIPMTSMSLQLPRRDGGLTVYYPGEATAITASDKSWTQTKLTADPRAVLTKVSLQLNDAALINVMEDLSMEIGRALGIKMDQELILGDGTSSYGGVQGLPSASNISNNATGNLFSEAVLADFSAVVGALPQKFHANASWLMSRAGYAESAERLAYAAGGNTTDNVASGEGRGSASVTGRSFMGYPVVFSDQMPAEANSAAAAYFGDFNYGVVIGEFGNVQIATSEHRYFEEGNLAIRGIYNYDLVLTDFSSTGAFSRLLLASS